MFDAEAIEEARTETQARVDKGFDFISRMCPNWLLGKDPDDVHQGSSDSCMLATAFGRSYTEIRRELGWTDQQLHDHGFYQIQDDRPMSEWQVGYEMLTQCARERMREELAKHERVAA